MRKFSLYVILCCTCLNRPAGQTTDDFFKEFDSFRQNITTQFESFRDSTNYIYAEYLSQSWEAFNLQAPVPVPRKPLPIEDTRYDSAKVSVPVILPTDTFPPVSYQETDIYLQPVAPDIKAQPGRQCLLFRYFGTPVEMSLYNGLNDIRLPSINENHVSACWLQLSKQPWKPFMLELLSLKDELNLNDWAFYQLLVHVSDACFPAALANEKVLFTVFMLNQAGYRVKTGRQKTSLFPLIAFRMEVYGTPYITFDDGNYYVISPNKFPSSEVVYSYRLNYGNAISGIDLAIRKPFRLDILPKSSKQTFENKTYMIEYNANLIALYDTYPQTVLSVYADTPLASSTRKSLEKELLPALKDKTEEEALAFLLAYVQHAFPYMPDEEQFGYEKYFFAEELFHYPYSDCEDRAILFSQLVRRFIGLDVVLLDYPNHVATGVKLRSFVEGDCVIVNNERYIVCDPSYIGAPLGRVMNNYRNVNARIIALK